MTEKEEYGFHPPSPITGGAVAPVEQSRAVQEVQAAIIVAKKFPRDEDVAFSRIVRACQRPKLAEEAEYAYPRGGQMVTGPSIRLAEVLAQNWQNLDFGIRELSQTGGESEVQAYAWDLETNVRQTKTFKVPHKRKARGSYNTLTDPRDIYEHIANQGARRLRACILGVIPGDVVDAAMAECKKTLENKNKDVPLKDRVRQMIVAFDQHGVTKEMIETRLGHKTDAVIEAELVALRKIYNSLKDGMSKREDWFSVKAANMTEETEDLTEKLQQQAPDYDTMTDGQIEDEWILLSENDDRFIDALKAAGYSNPPRGVDGKRKVLKAAR